MQKITIEVDTDTRLTDLICDGFDAGIRWGDSVPQDMVAVRVSPDTRMIAVVAPSYLDRCPSPQTPADLEHHNCIKYRSKSSGGYLPWAFERDGKEFRPRIEGQLTLDDSEIAGNLILAGVGVGYVLEPQVLAHLKAGRLVEVLGDWSPPYPGLHLYYPNRQVTPALRALISVLRLSGREPPLPAWDVHSVEI